MEELSQQLFVEYVDMHLMKVGQSSVECMGSP